MPIVYSYTARVVAKYMKNLKHDSEGTFNFDSKAYFQ